MTTFEAAVEMVNELPTQPSKNEMLELYALYKQHTVGDVNIPQPGRLKMRDRAKWNAWNGKKGISQEEAGAGYIALVEELKAKYE
ncbi:hypothetical protein PCE1_002926 [Barthelona sp. PCE]